MRFTLLSLVMLLVCLGCGADGPAASVEEVAALDDYGPAPEFLLTVQDGSELTTSDLRGSVWVVDFIFTNCVGACPAMTTQMGRVQEALAGETHLRLLSITVDPERDSLEALTEFADEYGALSPQWMFARAVSPSVTELSVVGFKLGAGDTADAITHSNRFVLVDGTGLIRGYYVGTDSDAVSQLIEDIKGLVDADDAD